MDSIDASVDEYELRAIKLRELKLRRQRLEMFRKDGAQFYRPHPKQDAFHRAGKFRRRMVRAGNRFGKSQMGVAEDTAWLRGERVWYPKGSPERTAGIPQRPVKLLVLTTDWEKVDEIFTSERGDRPGKVWSFLERGSVKKKIKNSSGVISELELHNGSILRFDTMKSYMSNPMGAESSDFDAIHVDEPVPEQMYKAHARGLMDRQGSCWFTLTPLSQMWIVDMFEGEKVLPDITWFEAGSVYDNPYLTPEAIAEFESLLTEDEKQCRLHGLPLELAGLVYKQFNTNKHVLESLPQTWREAGWTDWHRPPLDWPVYTFIDPHPQTPHAVLFGVATPTDHLVLYDEIFEKITIDELAKRILEKQDGRYVFTTQMDPLGFIEHPITSQSFADVLRDHGLVVEKAVKDLSNGIMETQAALSKDYIYVVPTLKRFLWEIRRYCWKEGENKPVDKDDHMMENFYRMVKSNPKYSEDTRKTPPVPSEGIPMRDIAREDLYYTEKRINYDEVL